VATKLLPTTVVGSYAQPGWLVDKSKFLQRLPSRVRTSDIWKPAPEDLAEAQDDATVLAIRDQERAGIDIISDGEIRRESYSNRFATSLAGIDHDNPGRLVQRSGKANAVPRVVAPIRWQGPVEVDDVRFLRANTDRTIKITLPGPFTMTQQAQDDHYGDPRAMALDYAAAVNAEMKALFEAGADIVQLDEPYVQARSDLAREFAVEAIDKALGGATGTTVVHLCFGYAHYMNDKSGGYSFLPELNACAADQISIEAAQPDLDLSILETLPDKTVIFGVIDLGDATVETPEIVADRVRQALDHLPPERLVLAPDCGMKYLARDVAFGKLRSMVEGATIVRQERGLA